MRPDIAAQRMEAAQRRRGVVWGDSCRTCHHFTTVWGRELCERDYSPSKGQFHMCVKNGVFLRQPQ